MLLWWLPTQLCWLCDSPSVSTKPDRLPAQLTWHVQPVALEAVTRLDTLKATQVRDPSTGGRADAASIAAEIQRQTDRRELQCSLLALTVKAGLIILGAVSLIRLSGAYQERLARHGELAAVVEVESAKLTTLQQRFDRLFSIGGKERLMGEQDQWIAPNRLRIIWR